MRIYRLLTLYDTANLGFSDEGPVADGIVRARLIHQCDLLIATPRIASVNPEGKKNIDVNIDTRTFIGHPLLLELTTTKESSDPMALLDVRQELEDRTAERAAVLTWSLQGAVGVRLADQLSSRASDDDPDAWKFDDVVPIEVTDFFQDIGTVASRVGDTACTLQKQTDAQRFATVTAMRWWRRARHTYSALDSYIAYWIIIETFAAHISDEESIRKSIGKAIATVFPLLTHVDDCRRAKRMTDVLYDARCKCVHRGQEDLGRHHPIFELNAATAYACMKFLLDGSVSEPPAHVLQALGI